MDKVKRMLVIAIISIFISSYILILAPFTSFDEEGFSKVLAYLTGILFWLGLVVGYTTFVIASKLRKKYFAGKKTNRIVKFQPGLIVFFSSRLAIVVDIICTVSIILFAVYIFNNSAFPEGLVYFIISTTIFFVQAHSIINGVNFRDAFNIDKYNEKKQRGDI